MADPIGPGAAARRLGASLLRLGRIRLELLAIEVQEEKERLAALLFWTVIAALSAAFGLVFAALTVTVLLWDSQPRWAVLALFAAVFATLSALAGWRLARMRAGGSTLLGASIGELRRDAEALDDTAAR
ncbi:MAG: phage holin family protein [Rubrivivax sp.]